jgi:prepilin-type N-terminal cleavage/methylation domain-containing protein
MKNASRRGFTLIELLIVMFVVGVLVAIALPKFAHSKEKAYMTEMKSDLRNLASAEEAYFADSVRYTASLGDLSYRQSTGVNQPEISIGQGYWTATITHTQIFGAFTCGIGVNTTNTVVVSAGEGEPACR